MNEIFADGKNCAILSAHWVFKTSLWTKTTVFTPSCAMTQHAHVVFPWPVPNDKIAPPVVVNEFMTASVASN